MGNHESESLRQNVLRSIGNFLYNEGFKKCSTTPEGILEVINLISDYHEEGVSLFPEVIITNSLKFFETIPNKEVVISEDELSVVSFKKAIKLCAPLAKDNWIIFIEVGDARIKFGLISAEMAETSLSIYNQTVGDLKVEYQGSTIAYIRNVGQKCVELAGLKTKLLVSLSLEVMRERGHNEISTIVSEITKDCNENIRVHITTYLEKLLYSSIRGSHGNLISILNRNISMDALKEEEQDGTYLPLAIDFEALVGESIESPSRETSVNLNAYASIVRGALSQDGIVVFTSKGELIAFHLIIKPRKNDGQEIVGGARTRAFSHMINSKLFSACFFKSQDGNLKIWKENE